MRLASRFGRYNSIRRERPLTDDELMQFVPSVFSGDKHESRSERYTYIPTINIINKLRDEGFQPFFACQSRVRDLGRREYSKHMLRLRREGHINGKEVPEIILLNSHDGSSSYQMIPGIFRFVCTNGLVCGNNFGEIRVPHKGDIVGQVIEGAYEVLGVFDKVTENMEAMPAFDRNGKSAGIWLNPLTTDDGNGLRGFSGEGRVKGSGDAQFVALQGSRNGESLLADNMQDGVRIARDNPDSGVVVRIAGEGRPWNPGAITGGRVWGDIPDNSVQPGAGNGEPVTAEVLAQRQAEEAIRRETERRADEIVRKMAENKPDLPDGKTELAVRDIAGQERDRSAISERETALPESVLRESQREREAVREVARENLLQERLQQMERDMVRDLQKEKTLGGD